MRHPSEALRSPRSRARAALAAWTAAALLATAAAATAQRGPEASTWVWRDQATGRLLYRTTPVGDRIPDFSGVGYMGGARPPDVDAVVPAERRAAVPLATGDATAAIQAAIDAVAARAPDANGMRGLVQLAPGTYDVQDQLRIRTGGIVLRGHPKTRLRGTGTVHRALLMVGVPKSEWEEVAGSRSEVSDSYVPVGATSLRVRDPERFQPGAEVVVLRPSTTAWISAIGMDRIPPQASPRKNEVKQWEPSANFDQRYERTVVSIEGDRLFLDQPLPTSLDRKYGPAYVYRYVFPERVERVGLVELHGEAVYDPAIRDRQGRHVDENHAATFILVGGARHVWMQRISGRHFIYATVSLGRAAVSVTVSDAASYDPVSLVTGGRRYAFSNSGQLSLLQDLSSQSGRHDFVNNAPSRGPNVFLRGKVADGFSEIGPHQRWSTGTLYDRIDISGARATLAAYNRGSYGTGHGHSGANMVFWNSRAPALRVESPPTAQNWVVGSAGDPVDPDDFLRTPPGIYDRHGAAVNLGGPGGPEYSLYEAQKAERSALRSRAWTRRVYSAGSHAAGADPAARGAPELAVELGPSARETIAAAVVRFGARRAGPGEPVLGVGAEPLRAPLLVTHEAGDVVTGTGVVPAAALKAVQGRERIGVAGGSSLRLLWVELELDFAPAVATRPAPGKAPGAVPRESGPGQPQPSKRLEDGGASEFRR